MYRYADDVERLVNMGLKPEHISEISGVRAYTLACSYSYSEQKCIKINMDKKRPDKKDIEIARRLLKRGWSLIRVLERFKHKNINIIYETFRYEYNYVPAQDIERSFFENCTLLLQVGLSLRNCAKLFTEANEGFIPDHSSLRKRLISLNMYVLPNKISKNKKKLKNKDKILCLKLIKKYNLRPVVEDFTSLYFRYFRDFNPNDVFKLLDTSNDLKIIRCSICGKTVVGKQFQRYCNLCRKTKTYVSEYDGFGQKIS